MSDDFKLQANFKFGQEYKETLLNIRADSAQEFQELVEFAVSSADAIVGAAIAFGVAYELKKPKDNPPPQRQSSWSNSGSQQSTQPAAAPSGPAPTCRHGEMKYVPGGYSQRTKKNYGAFWSCQGPRNEQCDTVQA
jgi:hypothetical protein